MAMAMASSMVAVFSLRIRLLHWLLAGSVMVAMLTHHGGAMHEASGWIALAAAMLRIALGFLGQGGERFAAFVTGPRRILGHAWLLAKGRAPRHLGHNPLGAAMVVALLALALVAGASGTLYVTDRFWGEGWVIALHAASAWPFAALIPLHLAGVLHASRAHRENLPAAMIHGRKRTR